MAGLDTDQVVERVNAFDLNRHPGQNRRVIVEDLQFGRIGDPGLFQGGGRVGQLARVRAPRAGGLVTAPILMVQSRLRAPGGISTAVL